MDEEKSAEWGQENWAGITSLEGAEPMWSSGKTLKAHLAGQ
jgi:hypothetical protein